VVVTVIIFLVDEIGPFYFCAGPVLHCMLQGLVMVHV
jgi:hypothetical protein